MSDPPPALPSVVPGAAAPPAEDVEALRRQIAEARAQVQMTARAIDQGVAQETSDRSMITRVVIQVFGWSIAAVLLAILAAAYASGKWDTVSTQATDLLKSVVLPIVTLVLGYYFGRAGKG